MLQTAEASCSHPAVRRRAQDRPTWRRLARVLKLGPHVHLPGHSSASQAPVGLTRMNKLAREELRRLSRPPSIEEEKLKFYIASCSFGLRSSACSWPSLPHVGSEIGDSNTGSRSLPHSPWSCSLPSPGPCKPANPLHHACPCNRHSVAPLCGAQGLAC